MSLEEQIDNFLNEKNITPYHHIYNADGNTGWDIEVLIEEFAERYAQQRVNGVLDDAADNFEKEIAVKSDYFNHRVGMFNAVKESILKLKNNEK